jgi:hypothetical protein
MQHHYNIIINPEFPGFAKAQEDLFADTLFGDGFSPVGY